MMRAQLTFIGGGNMARALIGGLLKAGWDKAQLCVAAPSEQTRSELIAMGLRAEADNAQAASGAEALVLAVKPQMAQTALAALAPVFAASERAPLLISVVAGLSTARLRALAGGRAVVARAMPNTPALIGCGMSLLCAGAELEDRHRRLADELFASVGEVQWLEDETLMDAATALSGCGPAYFFYLIECLAEAGQALGLSAQLAARLSARAALGASCMATQPKADAAKLRQQVSSPGGATEQAIESFRRDGLKDAVARAAAAASKRSAELGSTS